MFVSLELTPYCSFKIIFKVEARVTNNSAFYQWIAAKAGVPHGSKSGFLLLNNIQELKLIVHLVSAKNLKLFLSGISIGVSAVAGILALNFIIIASSY